IVKSMLRCQPDAAATCGVSWMLACSGPDQPLPDAGDAANEAEVAIAQPAGFDRFCAGHDFASSLTAATVSPLSGTYAGFYANGLNANSQKIAMPAGAQE